MFNTYGLLKAAVANWLNREDTLTVEAIPGFIQLAEADIRADMESRHVTTEDALVLDSAAVTLPEDVGSVVDLFLTSPASQAGPIRLVTRSTLAELTRRYGRGPVRFGAITDGVLHLTHDPSDESDAPTATIIYHPRVTALVDDDDTNWFLENHPNLYLYAALRHSAAFLRDDARKATWDAAYAEHLSRMMLERDAHEHGATPLNITFGRGIGER
jgi:hypothetical protein